MRFGTLIVSSLLLVSCGGPDAPAGAGAPDALPIRHVGSARCAECHEGEAAAWRGSHHDLAMQHATRETVLGDFEGPEGDGVEFDHFGVRSRFFRRGDAMMVATDGPDGALAEYRVAYTFGVEPLQQYLVATEGPAAGAEAGAIGRLQALPIAWDTRPRAAGGQRWFHLYPEEPIRHDDPLHWTRRLQNWNRMCADCHSTGLRKNYDPAQARYATTWDEIDVSCEACHGAGSAHAAAPASVHMPLQLADRGEFVRTPGAATAHRVGAAATGAEVDGCAFCHSRRMALGDRAAAAGSPLGFLDAARPELIEPGLYFPDGQIRDEVYVFGSFLQSKMHHAGVTCTDCHEPHALSLHAEGNALCVRCHDPERFDHVAHHGHASGSAGAFCVDCHMPERTYMVIDRRRDHGIKVPRWAPESIEEDRRRGVPNACDGCHQGVEAESLVADWREHGARPVERPAAPTFVSDIVRASRLAHGAADAAGAVAGLDDANALVRLGAVRGIERLPAADGRPVGPLADRLRDERRAVRQEALRVLAPVANALADGDRQAFRSVLAEYESTLRYHADDPAALVSLAVSRGDLGDLGGAERACRDALRLDPSWVPAVCNLADLLRVSGRDEEGERLLRDFLARERGAAVTTADRSAVHHALGLLLVRRGERVAAIEHLERAAVDSGWDPNFVYVFAIAMQEIETPQAGPQRSPGTRVIEAIEGALGRAQPAGDGAAAPTSDPLVAELQRMLRTWRQRR